VDSAEAGDSASRRSLAVSTLGFGVLDATSRLALPASLLLLVWGYREWAVFAAASATAASAARGFLVGRGTELALIAVWQSVVTASHRRSAIELANRNHGEEGVSVLLDAMEQEASHQASTQPRLVSLTASAVLVAAAVATLLGPRWLIAGVLLFAVVAALVALAHRRVSAAHRAILQQFGALSVDFGVLLDAALELRAQAAEHVASSRVLAGARRFAQHRRTASTYSALLSLLPLAIAALALAGPSQAGISWVRETVEHRAPEAGILGVAAAVLGVGLARTVEEMVSTRPARAALARFVEGAGSEATTPAQVSNAADAIANEDILLEAVRHRYEGSDVDTPSSVNLTWPPRTGLAITGANGSGKSTLLLVLTGMLTPTEGRACLGDDSLDELTGESRRRVAFLPQSPFFSPDHSIEWHLSLTGYEGSEPAMMAALDRVGLRTSLEQHAQRSKRRALDVPASELSGGERSRLALARALLRDADLILLDEPEASLDRAGRELLRELLDELARERRIAVVAHDESVIPERFQRLQCERHHSDTTT